MLKNCDLNTAKVLAWNPNSLQLHHSLHREANQKVYICSFSLGPPTKEKKYHPSDGLDFIRQTDSLLTLDPATWVCCTRAWHLVLGEA